jgi:hypothetical protein
VDPRFRGDDEMDAGTTVKAGDGRLAGPPGTLSLPQRPAPPCHSLPGSTAGTLLFSPLDHLQPLFRPPHLRVQLQRLSELLRCLIV